MDTNTLVTPFIVGFLLPLFTAVFQSRRWSNAGRTLMGAVFAVMAGIATAYLQGQLDLKHLALTTIIVLTTSGSAFRNYWKPGGASGAIEAATTPGIATKGEDEQ